MQFFVLIVSLVVLQTSSSPVKYQEKLLKENLVPKATCDKVCDAVDPNELTVHLIPHSHNDVGWLKTVDQYYYGDRNSIPVSGVQYIIDSVLDALTKNPNRRFVQVENAFLWMWWERRNAETRQRYLDLVNNGQIEIIGGAWSMNDEAATNYQSIIDQFTWGLRFLNDTFGSCAIPRVGWQIDPFGHSREMASIFAQLGFDGLIFARLDWRDYNERKITKTKEMIWRGSANIGNSSNLFTSIMPDFYNSPEGFCFDIRCKDDPIIDNVESAYFNQLEKVKNFTAFVNEHSKTYTTNNILIPMGGDFTYQVAHRFYINMEKLMEGFAKYEQFTENGRKIRVKYSSPNCYLTAVNEASKINKIAFPVKTDDFMPYASIQKVYWTGYYTSRPTQKRLERQGNNLLQVTKQLTTFAKQESTTLEENITPLRQAMGIMQHHDAITGTERQHVAQDYARILKKAMDRSHANVNSVIPKLLAKNPSDGATVNLNLETCILANVTHCKASQSNRFVVTVYNPLSRSVSQYVRIPVSSKNFTITGPNGQNVNYQITPSVDDFSYVEEITPSKFDLVFFADALPPLGMKLYYVQANNPGDNGAIPPDSSPTWFQLGDSQRGFTLNPGTGRLVAVRFDGQELPVSHEFMYYLGAQGKNAALVWDLRVLTYSDHLPTLLLLCLLEAT